MTVVDANAPIEKRLPSLVNEAREGKSQPLTDALSWLEPDALNTLLTTTENGVLPSFVKTAQEGNPEYLADVLFRLEPNALKDLFIDEKNGILDLLVEVNTSEDLAWMLSTLGPNNLNEVLTNGNNKALNLVVGNECLDFPNPKHLVWVIFRLKPMDLKAVLQTKGLFISCYLADMLSWLKPKELNDMLTNLENGVLDSLKKALDIWLRYSLGLSLMQRSWEKK
jgi:hypothetical protein